VELVSFQRNEFLFTDDVTQRTYLINARLITWKTFWRSVGFILSISSRVCYT